MLAPNRCLYIPVDQGGGMLNDPVLVQAGSEDRWVDFHCRQRPADVGQGDCRMAGDFNVW